MISSNKLILDMANAGSHWRIPFFDFVDEFRRSKGYSNIDALTNEFIKDYPGYAALIAATIAYLSDEFNIVTDEWVNNIPALDKPWFVCGIKKLETVIKAKCPVQFKQRNVFVLDNFLFRV